MTFQAYFSYAVLGCLVVAVTLTAVSIPIGRDLQSKRKRLVRSILPWTMIACGAAATLAVIGGYEQDLAQAELLKIENLRNEVSKLPGDGTPTVAYSPLLNVRSVIYGSLPGSDIDCTQVKKGADGSWDIFGSITVRGLTLSQIRLGPHVFNVGGFDVTDILAERCGTIRIGG